MPTDKVTSDMILKQLAARHTEDFFMTEVKNGPTQLGTHLRMDAVAIKKSWANPCVSAYEVKVSRNDFVRDDKWPGYMQYCNRFSFACPDGLIQKDELPPEVGLFWYKGDGKHFKIVRHPVFRPVDIPSNFFMYIIMCKLDSDRYPFFSDKSEYFKSCIENKRTASELGHKLSYKIAEELTDMKNKLYSAEFETERAKEAIDLQNKAINLLRSKGISWERWKDETWVDALQKYFESGSRGITYQLRQAIGQAEEVLNYLKTGIKEGD